MKKDSANTALFNYMDLLSAKPKKELLLVDSSKIFSNFSNFFSCPLFVYSLKKIHSLEKCVNFNSFICKVSSSQYDFYEMHNEVIISKNGNKINTPIHDFMHDDIYLIEKSPKEKNENSLYKTIMHLTPKSGYLIIPLVIFGLLSPLYSNVFNSRLVYATSNLTFFLITSVFLAFVFFEFFIRKKIKEKALFETQKNVNLISDYFFFLFKSSKTSNLSIKIRNIEQTSAYIWENVPLFYVDIGFISLYSVCLLLILGQYFAILFIYYLLVAIYMFHVRFQSYKNLIQSLKHSGEKSSFLFSFERKKSDLLFANNAGATSLFNENYNVDQLNKSLLDSMNHKWNELTKMNAFVSMVVMYFCCFLSIKAGTLQISAVIAVMIVNSRLSSNLGNMIAKLYQLRVQKHNFFESCSAIYKEIRKIAGLNVNEIVEIEAKALNKDILKQKGFLPITHHFKKGKTYALIGPSGSGKTTILKILSGEDNDFEGEVSFNKVSTKNISAETLALHVAFHSANTDFLKASLKKNFEYHGIVNFKQITEILKFSAPKFEIDHDKFEVFEAEQLNFSNGEKQKLLLVMSLAKNPSLIVLDESTSFLSATDSIKTMQWIKEKHSEAIIIFASHNSHLLSFADEKISLQPPNPKIRIDMRN